MCGPVARHSGVPGGARREVGGGLRRARRGAPLCRSGDRRSEPGGPCGGAWRRALCGPVARHSGVPGGARREVGGGLRRARRGAPLCRSGDRRSEPGAPCGGAWRHALCGPVARPSGVPGGARREVGGGLRRARRGAPLCRSGDRRSEPSAPCEGAWRRVGAGLWPGTRAFREVRAVRLVEGCDVCGAERRGCRSGDRRSEAGAPCGGAWRHALCGPVARPSGVPGGACREVGGGLRRARRGAPRVPVWRPAFQGGCAVRGSMETRVVWACGPALGRSRRYAP